MLAPSLLFIMPVPISFGQDGSHLPSLEAGHTGGYTNGRFRTAFTIGEKATYLMAYRDGAALFLASPSDAHPAQERLYRLYPRVLTLGEITRAVDAFYGLPENAAVPIMAAITASAMRTAGMDEAAIQDWILRNRYAANGVH
ncbi:MAG: hypothetical protein ABSF64_25270 [Bryobacteraceae bacterium]|jgi:hypothetical protein